MIHGSIFPEDRIRENKQAHCEGFWLDIWKHFDTTKITKVLEWIAERDSRVYPFGGLSNKKR